MDKQPKYQRRNTLGDWIRITILAATMLTLLIPFIKWSVERLTGYKVP